MATHFFSGSKSDLLPEIEKLRELQGFCSHDLRSQIGAVTGLLCLIEDQIGTLDEKTKSSFATALTSAQVALDNLDLNTAASKPSFEVVWLIGFTSAESGQMALGDALKARVSSRPSPTLFLNFETSTEWQSRVKKYRPLAVFFKSRDALGSDASVWIPRLGPQLTKIYLFDASGEAITGVRADSLTILQTPPARADFSKAIVESIESLPRARS